MQNNSKLAIWAMLFLAAGSPLNFAGAIIGATEPTQLMNNIELMNVNLNTLETVSEEIKQNVTLANQYATQTQQYMTQLKQLQNYVPDDIMATYRSAVQLQQNYNDLNGAVSQLYGSIQDSKTASQNIFRDMSLQGLTPQQYLDKIKSNTDHTRDNVTGMLGAMSRSLQTVQSSYDQVKQFQAKIPATEGLHQSMQLMNSQMNAMLVQQGQFIDVSMAALQKNINDQSQKIADEDQAQAAAQAWLDNKTDFAKSFKSYFGR
ncbi:hypothetical protein QU487_06925 [Crenobacter sp. SG2305]|uniref:hypothetical protein n=1 Tax=Crenobacter oryzisoli TaxID=3056844 RepID=UPI0025AA67A4|nr:hypothetical protein [Crenobacter sp. SG2305]MDN0082488.1 hypothetical protein [Crenobacter sp. SG2305]